MRTLAQNSERNKEQKAEIYKRLKEQVFMTAKGNRRDAKRL